MAETKKTAKRRCFYFWWGHRDSLGINACGATVTISLRFCSQNLKHVSLGINACGATVTISLRFCSQNFKYVSLGINACGATVTISLRFCSQNLLVVEPFAAVAALTGSRPVAETKKPPNGGVFISGGATGTRTLDPMIKSHLLYQLSYSPKTELF